MTQVINITKLIAKIDRVLEKHVLYHELPERVTDARIVREDVYGRGIVIAFPDGSWHYSTRQTNDWRGCVAGKYNIYVGEFVHAASLLRKVTYAEAEAFIDYLHTRRRRDDAARELKELRAQAEILGYEIKKIKKEKQWDSAKKKPAKKAKRARGTSRT